jgi:hypothetical protein
LVERYKLEFIAPANIFWPVLEVATEVHAFVDETASQSTPLLGETNRFEFVPANTTYCPLSEIAEEFHLPGVPLVGVSAEVFAVPPREPCPSAYPDRVVVIETVALAPDERPETVTGKELPEGVPAVALPDVVDRENV